MRATITILITVIVKILIIFVCISNISQVTINMQDGSGRIRILRLMTNDSCAIVREGGSLEGPNSHGLSIPHIAASIEGLRRRRVQGKAHKLSRENIIRRFKDLKDFYHSMSCDSWKKNINKPQKPPSFTHERWQRWQIFCKYFHYFNYSWANSMLKLQVRSDRPT